MLEILLRGVFTAIFNKGLEDLEPPDPATMEINFSDAESVLHAAARYDHVGEWIDAVKLYGYVLETWPEEHGDYSRNCIQVIKQKMELA